MFQQIAHGLAFGLALFAVMAVFRIAAPPPFETIGLSRFTFIRLHFATFARFAVLPSILYMFGSFLVGSQWPYWWSAALGGVCATVGSLLLPAAASLTRSLPSVEVGVSVAVRVLSVLLSLSSVFLPYAAQWLNRQIGA